MANKRRETEAEKAKREREERIELLKMKQGLIEESELIPENEHVEATKPRGWSKVSNFFYRNKAYIFMTAFLAVVMTILVVQLVTKEREDLYVLAVAFEGNTEMGLRIEDIEVALERYCPDFDGNGKIHVTVNYIDHTSGAIMSDYDRAQDLKLLAETMNGSAQLIVTDEKFIEWANGDEGADSLYYKNFFLDQTDLCSEDMLYKDVGVRVNRTDFIKEAKWESCPGNVIILVRSELDNGTGNVKTNAVNRERSMTVLQNILDGNVVNPEPEGD